jgi:phospho-N-acetylmuramoyl-pentapeptide-transferase
MLYLWALKTHGLAAGAAARAALALLTSLGVCLLAGPSVVAWLARMKLRERTEKTPIEDEALRKRIEGKSGTPTMGGLLLLAAGVGSAALWADLRSALVLVSLGCTLVLGALGAVDDRMKLRGMRRTDRGLKARHKLAAQAVVGAAVGGLLLWAGRSSGVQYGTPLLSVPGVVGALLFIGWATFLVGAMSNATNVTDGMDGLLAGLTPLAATVLAGACWAAGTPQTAAALGIAHVPGAAELAVVCAALTGACLGFLCFNRHPAQVFMGDTGALAIGGGLASAAVAARQEALLLLVGAVFVVEFGSSLLQIGFFKLTGRRILPIAPLHIMFQKRGDAEPKVVRGFYLAGAASALAGLTFLLS